MSLFFTYRPPFYLRNVDKTTIFQYDGIQIVIAQWPRLGKIVKADVWLVAGMPECS